MPWVQLCWSQTHLSFKAFQLPLHRTYTLRLVHFSVVACRTVCSSLFISTVSYIKEGNRGNLTVFALEGAQSQLRSSSDPCKPKHLSHLFSFLPSELAGQAPELSQPEIKAVENQPHLV